MPGSNEAYLDIMLDMVKLVYTDLIVSNPVKEITQ